MPVELAAASADPALPLGWSGCRSVFSVGQHLGRSPGSAGSTRVQIGRLPTLILRPFSGFWANFPHFKLHPDDRFSWAAGQSTHYLRTHASKAIGSVAATRVQIGRLPTLILRPFSGFWANFPHFKLHPDDRFSWAAGQSTHCLRTHASKAIGSVAATRCRQWIGAEPCTSGSN